MTPGKLAFVGAGRWATALACGLHKRFDTVALYDCDAAGVERLRASRTHPDLPTTARLPDGVLVTADAGMALDRAEVVLFAVPAAAIGTAARSLGSLVPAEADVVSVTKGFDPDSDERLSVVLGRALGRTTAVLAGPGIPYDFALGDPTSLVAASTDEPLADRVRDRLTHGMLRVYSCPDTIGVETGAALKNVIALAVGIADGIGLGINARAALVARGLAEMIRLGQALGADPATFAGLSGVGDLVVTAFSNHSRNHTLGVRIGREGPAPGIQPSLTGVAEGVGTCVVARRIAADCGVELPITEEVFRIVHETCDPRAALRRLLARPPKKEVWS